MRRLPGVDLAALSGRHKTYAIKHVPDIRIKTVCEEIGCDYWRNGWQTVLDESTDQGSGLAMYIRHSSGRTFREMRAGDGLTVFRFEPGQRCFQEHNTLPEIFSRRLGDQFRWHSEPYIHKHGRDWTEDYNEHTGRIREEMERG